MEYIAITELRTKAKALAQALERGSEVKLIRRSKVIGRVIPDKNEILKTIDAKRLEAKIQKLDLPRLTLKEIDRRYRAVMKKKHGQGLY